MIVNELATPSTLADVIGQVREAFDELYKEKIPFQIGKHYVAEFGAGGAPKVLFVPEVSGSYVTDPIGTSSAASYVHACDVHVRGSEGLDDDLERFRSVYDLVNVLIGAINVAGSGRVNFGKASDDSPSNVNAYGAGVSFGFTYRRDVPHWPERWAATFGGPGVLATGMTIDPTARPKE